MGRTGTAEWKRIVAQVRRDGAANGWPCALCGGAKGPIDYRTRAQADREAKESGEFWLVGATRPLALAVDHIVPVVAGGTDDLESVQPSHQICNTSAGAKTHPKKHARPQAQPVLGVWVPLDGNGPELAGRAVPGTRTRTHVFRGWGKDRHATGDRSPPASQRIPPGP
jgi:hypothetical protein